MNPHVLWLLGGALVLALVAATIARKPHRDKSVSLNHLWPLEPKRRLLSQPEQVLYCRLVQACPRQIVLCQVQLMQMLRFKRGGWNPGIANRINQLSIDFLIVNPDTSIVVAIELDDASHERADRRAADARKTHALRSAAIPLLRWHTRQLPDTSVVATALGEFCSGSEPNAPAVGS
jgi:very-short-patch-repair endonuclease